MGGPKGLFSCIICKNVTINLYLHTSLWAAPLLSSLIIQKSMHACSAMVDRVWWQWHLHTHILMMSAYNSILGAYFMKTDRIEGSRGFIMYHPIAARDLNFWVRANKISTYCNIVRFIKIIFLLKLIYKMAGII